MESQRVLPGTKKGYSMGTAEEPFWNPCLLECTGKGELERSAQEYNILRAGSTCPTANNSINDGTLRATQK